MAYNPKKTARINYIKAGILTVLFHAALLGGLFMTAEKDIKDYFPEAVKEWLQPETPAESPKEKQKSKRA